MKSALPASESTKTQSSGLPQGPESDPKSVPESSLPKRRRDLTRWQWQALKLLASVGDGRMLKRSFKRELRVAGLHRPTLTMDALYRRSLVDESWIAGAQYVCLSERGRNCYMAERVYGGRT